MGVKGEGFIYYIDVDSDNQYRDAGCIFNIKAPGFSRGVVNEEVCLGTDTVTKDTGPLEYTEFEADLEYTPNGTIDGEIDTAVKADTEIQACIKYPFSTPVYQYFDMKFVSAEPQSVSRDNTKKRRIVGVIRSDPAGNINTTAPTLEA